MQAREIGQGGEGRGDVVAVQHQLRIKTVVPITGKKHEDTREAENEVKEGHGCRKVRGAHRKNDDNQEAENERQRERGGAERWKKGHGCR